MSLKMVINEVRIKESIEDALHLTGEILDEHFGNIPDIRKEHEDREEVDHIIVLKTIAYEIILKRLLELNLEEFT
jgi:hypothetical protein